MRLTGKPGDQVQGRKKQRPPCLKRGRGRNAESGVIVTGTPSQDRERARSYWMGKLEKAVLHGPWSMEEGATIKSKVPQTVQKKVGIRALRFQGRVEPGRRRRRKQKFRGSSRAN